MYQAMVRFGAVAASGIHIASHNRSHRSVVVPCDRRTRHDANGNRRDSATHHHRGQIGSAARSPVDLLPRWVRPSSDRLRLRRPKHPQWYYNLKAHPQCQFGDERFVATEVTDPDEYVRLVALAEKV
jgi:hypothetical protein